METKVTNQQIKSKVKHYMKVLDDTLDAYDLGSNADIQIAYTNIKKELEKLVTKL
mgnify:CR=1 FL=1|tara:strand:+ start:3953 stop:4117 length:165 start_codon:yes stop_codon:yes gene_type:complete